MTEVMALSAPGEDLVAGTRAAEAIMSERHPELGPEAMAALGFYYGSRTARIDGIRHPHGNSISNESRLPRWPQAHV
ncbi:hypothetical protein ACH4S8_31315 [Streptomyces sp. NPDC021080]|uniref:hypothetical protein n=1 Tax=Streptomyces sp. NPDC021080 TaxID=3365110 RepID=UPI0037A6D1EA